MRAPLLSCQQFCFVTAAEAGLALAALGDSELFFAGSAELKVFFAYAAGLELI